MRGPHCGLTIVWLGQFLFTILLPDLFESDSDSKTTKIALNSMPRTKADIEDGKILNSELLSVEVIKLITAALFANCSLRFSV